MPPAHAREHAASVDRAVAAAAPTDVATAREVFDRADRLRDAIGATLGPTPLVRAHELSAETGVEVWLKLESLQVTGSFKARGAFAKLTTSHAEARARGVVTASSGNHGAAVAWAMRALGLGGIVFVPEGAARAKVARIVAAGAEVRAVPGECLDAERAARAHAAETGAIYVSPYNDLDVVAGQGTIAFEILDACRQAFGAPPDAVAICAGGGGLVGGAGAVLKVRAPTTTVVAVAPGRSYDLVASLRAGAPTATPSLSTLSDGSAGNIELDAVTLAVCAASVDATALVSEEAIAAAMRSLAFDEHLVVEGAAAVPLAWLRANAAAWRGRRVVLVLCGGNVDPDTLARVLDPRPRLTPGGPGGSRGEP